MKRYIGLFIVLSLVFAGFNLYANKEEKSKEKVIQKSSCKDCPCTKTDSKCECKKGSHSCNKKGCNCKEENKDCNCKNCKGDCHQESSHKCSCKSGNNKVADDTKEHNCHHKDKNFSAE